MKSFRTFLAAALIALLPLAAAAQQGLQQGNGLQSGGTGLQQGNGLQSGTGLSNRFAKLTYVLPLGSNTVAAAYSTRKLRAAYAGAALNLHRTSDNTNADISFAVSSANADAAIVAFCGAANAKGCSLAKWYDQSGNAADLSNTTVAAQPTLSPAWSHGHAGFLYTPNQLVKGTLASAVGASTGAIVASYLTSNVSGLYAIEASTNANVSVITSASTLSCRRLAAAGDGTTTLVAPSPPFQATCTVNANLARIFVNGVKGTDNTNALVLPGSTSITIGDTQPAPALPWSGVVGELIVFAPDISLTDNTAISANQKAYWRTP